MKEKGDGEVESTSGANNDMPVEQILEAELAVDPKIDTYIDAQVSDQMLMVIVFYIVSQCYFIFVVWIYLDNNNI